MLAPITGPTLGGYLTELYTWRFVFYVNLPFGIFAVTGLLIFLPKAPPQSDMKFDWTGFLVLAIGVGSLQLMLDRGGQLGWFTSCKILLEAVLAGVGLYLLIIHMFTADRPFLPPGLFKDRNFGCGVTMVFFTGTLLLASSSLVAPYLENLAGYPVEVAGMATAPRGVGTIIGMQLASRLSARIDHHLLMAMGLLILGAAFNSMSFWTPDVTQSEMIATLMIQGSAIGFVFNPMTVMAFTILPASLRPYSTSLQSLCRSMGQAVGVSITSLLLVGNTQISHADMAAGITPFDRALQGHDAISRALSPDTPNGAALLDQMINHQAQIIAFNNDFSLMKFVVVPPLLLLFLIRPLVRPAPLPAAGD